ncbi:MAG: hypothetical protein VX770_03865 [Candidatus Neomarinimicrobiota bacterium]|nr:hypothetical protein [Candidatus Neomarinimicrobiota bacterium]
MFILLTFYKYQYKNMLQAILGYIIIFLTIFLSSISISFTILKSNIKEPNDSKYRLLQNKKSINGLLRNFNKTSKVQDSLRRELVFEKVDLEYRIALIDSLLYEMKLNKNRLKLSQDLINKNTKILSKELK